jgi:predicted dehydrogenase
MFRLPCLALCAVVMCLSPAVLRSEEGDKPLKAGIIGLDTSHVIAFTKLLNDPAVKPDLAGCRVVAAYPKGSPDIESSTSRVPMYTEQIQTLGVEIVDSIPELLKRVDVVFLETNDGRPHLEQVLPVLMAGKPVFVDKPLAGSLKDGIAIFEAAEKYGVPLFSSSSYRFGAKVQELRNGSIGKVMYCETGSPASLEATHPDLFWYGIHGVEALFTIMGTGCQAVRRTSEDGKIVVEGKWEGGRTGVFREDLKQGIAKGTLGETDAGKSDGYRPMLVECVKFFKSGKPPVSAAETLEIYAFMEAADESKRQGGAEVTLKSVLDKARQK